MNKLPLAGLVVGGVGTTCAVAGVALRYGTAKGPVRDGKIQSVREDYSDPHFSNIAELRKIIVDNECAKESFGDVEFEREGTAISFNSHLGLEKPKKDDDYKSCLVVTWRKNVASDKKWNGTFNWLWILRSGQRGLVLATIANALSEGKLQFDGILYYLEEGSGGAWTVKHHLRMADGKTAGPSGLGDFIPSPHTTNPVAKEAGTHWGFLSSAEDLNDICAPGDCPASATDSPSTKTWSLEKKADAALSETKALQEWCKDLKWWTSLYGDHHFNLPNTLDNLKGTWRNSLADS